jgi:phosphoenolpyruvate synthase/pyruvate phosphate dikinase
MCEAGVDGTKQKQLEKEAEKDYIQKCLEKDEQAKKADYQKKIDNRIKNIEIRSFLES